MAAKASQTGLMALWKRGWSEIPEVMGSSVMAVIGLTMGVIGLKHYYDNDGDNRKYKNVYTVYRPDDPRVQNIKQ
ncbi:uncharacterized protein LOC132201352 [Neocloeon triangulifer]|uniref:uncharacterized protein LOC132201352 n=1 Tax=Neocloeon triangulifer TaxID=2078957 RepID=UPI00286F38E6|nr:uncharacterized protein LOC132201352 [Neocloeon triangulifer]